MDGKVAADYRCSMGQIEQPSAQDPMRFARDDPASSVPLRLSGL